MQSLPYSDETSQSVSPAPYALHTCARTGVCIPLGWGETMRCLPCCRTLVQPLLCGVARTLLVPDALAVLEETSPSCRANQNKRSCTHHRGDDMQAFTDAVLGWDCMAINKQSTGRNRREGREQD